MALDLSPKTLWRISDFVDLTGEGARKASARWHTRGSRVVYLADSPSSALWEVVVHLEIEGEDTPAYFSLLKISFPDSLEIQQLALPEETDWKLDEKFTRGLGDRWLAEGKTCLARVPSVIISETWNYLLNPQHPGAAQVKIVSVTRELYDRRIFRFGAR
jgi:RES domain-containing protein